MINPILIIAAAALFLCSLAVRLLNKPKIPVVTGTLIIVLLAYVIITFLLDSAIVSFSSQNKINDFIQFIVSNPIPTYIELEDSFKTLMVLDTSVFVMSLVSLFSEALIILKKDSKK